jgi:hypothetical protein
VVGVVNLSVLIVTWNTRELLRDCLRSLLASLDTFAAEVIVVDNASEDGTAEMLRYEFGHESRLRLLANDANLGFARGNNDALALARGTTIAVVNPDTVFDGPVLAELSGHLSAHPEVGIVSCGLVGLDGTPQSLHRAFPTLPSLFFVDTRPGRWIDRRLLGHRAYRRSRLLHRPHAGTMSVDQVAGACLVMRRAVIDRVGGLFDERLPLYGNDVDLSRRVRDAGLDVQVRYDLIVRHHGGGSLSQLDLEVRRALLWNGFEVYYRLHEPRWRQVVLRALRTVRLGARSTGRAEVTTSARERHRR